MKKILPILTLSLIMLTGCSDLLDTSNSEPEKNSKGRIILDTNDETVEALQAAQVSLKPYSEKSAKAQANLQTLTAKANRGELTKKEFFADLRKYGYQYCKASGQVSDVFVRELNKYSWEYEDSEKVIDSMIKEFRGLSSAAKECAKTSNAPELAKKIDQLQKKANQAITNIQNLEQ